MTIQKSQCNLWQLFVKGDSTAFKEIISQNSNYLFQYGIRYSQDEELVKDTIQELFIRLWDKKANLCEDVNSKAYLTASLRRALHLKSRSLGRFKIYIDSKKSKIEFEISAEEDLIKKERSSGLSQAMSQMINSLPNRQKEVIYLKFFQELNRDEISSKMGISNQTVSNLLQLGLNKLRKEFNDEPQHRLFRF